MDTGLTTLLLDDVGELLELPLGSEESTELKSVGVQDKEDGRHKVFRRKGVAVAMVGDEGADCINASNSLGNITHPLLGELPRLLVL